MAFYDRVLSPPSYGFIRDGQFYVPTRKEIFKEFFFRTNPLNSRKHWLPFFYWTLSLLFAVPLVLFLVFYFSWPLMVAGFLYSMVALGTHGTIWLHRYSTHRAYKFKNSFFRFICRNLVIKIVPEETYVVSHHVHHRISEKAGDPYNTHAGFWYCFLADVNHQMVNPNLDQKDYAQLCQLLEHTGVWANTYDQYQYWGTVCNPFRTALHYAGNWAFWYAAFYAMGGHALALALFGWSGVWAIGVRTYNYEGHGKGQNRQKPGIDFYKRDLSINQNWPGYVAGEWHNNHHLYPQGARSGFLPYQFDLAWVFIWTWNKLGAITSFKDFTADFFRDHYNPYLASLTAAESTPAHLVAPDELSKAALLPTR